LRNKYQVLAFLGLFLTFSASTLAQTELPSSAGAMKPASPAAGGVRAEVLNELSYFEKRFTDLANAMPANKYTWRPAEGVRSVGEVFLHVAAANYNLPRPLGTQPPAGIDVRGLEKSTTEKSKILETLKNSFTHLRGVLEGLSHTDVEKSVQFLGKDNTYRGVMIFILRHLGEHLGQSIAYARMNGVVPPWTEEQQRQQKQQPPQQHPQNPKP
jgi:uncharacterized damage-inducible protein DinB